MTIVGTGSWIFPVSRITDLCCLLPSAWKQLPCEFCTVLQLFMEGKLKPYQLFYPGSNLIYSFKELPNEIWDPLIRVSEVLWRYSGDWKKKVWYWIWKKRNESQIMDRIIMRPLKMRIMFLSSHVSSLEQASSLHFLGHEWLSVMVLA